MQQYKNYIIEPFESSPERWRALVRRVDGHMIYIAGTGNSVPSIETGGMESFSADDAIKLAKEMVDGGGVN